MVSQFNVSFSGSNNVWGRTLSYLFLIFGLWGGGLGAPTHAIADEREIARSLLDQLDDRRFSERKAAFLKLCDPKWEIDGWLDEQSRSTDPNRAALALWIRRLRGIPGTMDERLEMMSDYQSLVDGDVTVITKYIDNRKTVQLVDLIEMLPESVREEMLQYRSADNPFDQAISAAWRDGNEEVIPRLLNAILPKKRVRVGLNERWRAVGMPPEWQVNEPIDIPEVHVAALERDGKIDEALAAAKRYGLVEEYEDLLIEHQRWDSWMQLDPLQKRTGITGWGDVQRILLLECLGRHEEALVFYELRKNDKTKTKSYFNQQKALMALVVGDRPTWEELFQSHAPNTWLEILFFHNEIDRLLESEGLSDPSVEALDRWFEGWMKSGGPLTKPIRFQSLFHRLGWKAQEEQLMRRIRKYVNETEGGQSLQVWDGVLSEWGKYGLDDSRLEVLAELSSRRDGDRLGNDLLLTQRGVQPVQGDTRAVTLETLFFKNFSNIRSAAIVLFDALRQRFPEMDARSRIAIVEDLHQGRMPTDWTDADLMQVFREMIRSSVNDPSVLEPMLVDLADILDVLGKTDEGLALLQDHADSHAASLLMAQYASKWGRIDEAAQLSIKIADRHQDDVNAYVLATQCLANARRFDDWMALQKRSLSRMDLWEWTERYFQTTRRTQRLEPQPEVLFLLESLVRNAPSTWHELWFGDAYTRYGSRIMADWYHRSIAQHPERTMHLRQLAIENLLYEIRSRSEDQFPDQGGGASSGLADVDWPLWTMEYERCFAACFWQAVQEGDEKLADTLIRSAHAIYPEQINTLIDVVPQVRSKFGEETLRKWYELYAVPMRAHLEKYPTDTLIANNTAWLAAKCGFDLDMAHTLAMRVVEQSPTDTYLDTLAEVEFTRGEIAKAIEISERCRSIKPRDPHHRRQLDRFHKAAKEASKRPE
jgi:tetratricopeptide (TPR) repeat protein